MRWGIEAMFSNFKTPDFGSPQSQIKKPDRLARLILGPNSAMYWAVSTRATEEQHAAQRRKKRGSKNPPVLMRALQSWSAGHQALHRWI